MIEGGLAVAELGAGTETCIRVVLPPASPCLVPIAAAELYVHPKCADLRPELWV